MLYLAEVKNQIIKGFIGNYSYTTEFKLLASQGKDQIWTPIPTKEGEKIITSNNLNHSTSVGALYIFNLDDNNQIQGKPELAGNRLVNYLKYYCRTLEKAKEQQEQIEQWQLSIQIQNEEIASRQFELEQQQEQLQAKEEELAKLQAERDRLYQAQQQLEDNSFSEGNAVSTIQEIVASFSNSIIDSQPLKNYYQQALESVNSQQEILNHYWQQLEADKNQIQQQENELNNTRHNLQQRREEFNATLENLQKVQIDLEVQQNIIQNKEEQLGQINIHLKEFENLRHNITILSGDITEADEEYDIDLNALESMALGDLENLVNNLREQTNKIVNFVNTQEEELTLQSNLVQELKQKLSQSSEIEKLSLETELDDAQEAMKLLDKTLVGQRRNLKKQQNIFNYHLKILNRRKGILDSGNFDFIDLNPILKNLDNQIYNTQEDKNQLESELQYLKESLEKIEEMLKQQRDSYKQEEQQLKQDEENWQEAKLHILQMQLKIQLLEAQLSPLQDQLNNIREYLQNTQEFAENLDNSIQQQRELVLQMQLLSQN